MYKCVYSDEYYSEAFYGIQNYDILCPNDPHFYQMCDKKYFGKVTNEKTLCENYMCRTGIGSLLSSTLMKFHVFIYDISDGYCMTNCDNTDIHQEECRDSVALRSGRQALFSHVCNDNCETITCEDEAVCNGYTYGMYCEGLNRTTYVPPRYICDNNQDCENGEDEANCTVTETTETVCRQKITGKDVPVYNYTRCGSPMIFINPFLAEHFTGGFAYCVKADKLLYQTNCSDPDKVGVTCHISGYKSTVSKYLVCFGTIQTISACDDGLDTSCFETYDCRVHKHLMCDNKKDCNDAADERHQICRSTTKRTCKRRVGKMGELPIPTSWIKDGVWDCENGEDETGEWETCGEGTTQRFLSSDDEKCENVYICREGDPGYVKLKNLCDGLETCGNENEICSVLSRSYKVKTSVPTTNQGLVKRLSYCVKGLESIEKLKESCTVEKFIFPDEDIFGASKTSLILPGRKESCHYMFGEQYVYRSCTDRCISAACPLTTIPRYEVCPHQVRKRIGTIVNNEYLIFVTKSFGTIYTNNYFVCDDKNLCMDYSKVCDLVYDCDDHSDESRCTNHFMCDRSRRLLPLTKKCDGHIDCDDLSDECNEQCSTMILKETYLKGLSWTIGIAAVVANVVIIGKSFKALKRCKTATALMNRLLIIMIAFGDFLIGCYLSAVAAYDTILLKNDYCHSQVTWITSLKCSSIGVLSTFGSQISLFSMTGLSIIRTYGIWNSMRIHGEVTSMRILMIGGAMCFMISISGAIAVIPIIAKFEDFFVNGVKFSDGLKIFTGTPNKATVLAVIQAYYGRAKDAEIKWQTLVQMTKDMFSHDFNYEDLTEEVGKVDFYGNDGVCLFKYFVQDEDPQRVFVWSILTLNFLCFIFISISYLVIAILSGRSSENTASSQKNRQVINRNRRMNQKIAMIISTDFLCWIPFIITCILHSLEVIDAKPWYSIFSMIILPINSVINPFLYDGSLTDAIAASILFASIQVLNSVQKVKERWSPPPTEEIELGQFENHPSNAGLRTEKQIK